MKKFFMIFSSFIFAIFIANYVKVRNEDAIIAETQWHTYEKTKHLKVQKHVTSEDELAKIQLPSSSHPKNYVEKKEAKDSVETRKIVGVIDEDFNIKDLNFSNEINPDWKDTLAENLIRLHSEDTKVLIKKNKSFLKVQHKVGTYVEEVLITYVKNNRPLSSFKALIDSGSGKILETWDQTINEKIKHPKREVSSEDDEEEAMNFELPLHHVSGITSKE